MRESVKQQQQQQQLGVLQWKQLTQIGMILEGRGKERAWARRQGKANDSGGSSLASIHRLPSKFFTRSFDRCDLPISQLVGGEIQRWVERFCQKGQPPTPTHIVADGWTHLTKLKGTREPTRGVSCLVIA